MRKCFWEPLDFRWSLGNVSLQNDTLLIHLEMTKNDFYMQRCKEESVLKLSRNSLQLWRFVNPSFSHGPIGANVLRMAWQLNQWLECPLACTVRLDGIFYDHTHLTGRPEALAFEGHSLDASEGDDGVKSCSRAFQPSVRQISCERRSKLRWPLEHFLCFIKIRVERAAVVAQRIEHRPTTLEVMGLNPAFSLFLLLSLPVIIM